MINIFKKENSLMPLSVSSYVYLNIFEGKYNGRGKFVDYNKY